MGTSDPGKFISFINSKCPKCRTGDMFGNSTYSLQKEILHKNCPHCGFRFERNLGYFEAAMYISYAYNVAVITSGSIATGILTGSDDPMLYIYVIFTLIFLFYPINLRYSKTSLLYLLGGEYARYAPSRRIKGKKAEFTEII